MDLRRLVIFDMDGTVLDTLADLLAAMNHALEKQGLEKRTLPEMQSFVGNGLYMMAVRAVPPGTENAVVEQVFNDFKTYYKSHLNVYTAPYEGVTEVLAELKKRGIKAAISSNKFHEGAKALAEYHFGSLIDMTLGESVLTPKKPDPTGAENILSALGVQKDEAVYVGDSNVDIETARNAGLDCICVSWGFRSRTQLEQAGANVIVDTPSQLLEVLLKA